MEKTNDTTLLPSEKDLLTTTESTLTVKIEPTQQPTTLSTENQLPAGEARKQLMERLIEGVKKI